MFVPRLSVTGLVALWSLGFKSSTGMLANSSSTSPSSSATYPNCSAHSIFIGDGFCHIGYNSAGCNYDGGDCCSCTCEDGELVTCGQNGYDCQDPTVSAACMNESSFFPPPGNMSSTPSVDTLNCSAAGGYIPYIDDGYCDQNNNIEYCGYDGGDCCTCTCVDNIYYMCGVNSYDCRDPSVPEACVNESFYFDPTDSNDDFIYTYGPAYTSDSEYVNCSTAGGIVGYVGDGFCDSINVIEECDYDGGDCCSCTCNDTIFSCGVAGYDCQDPAVSPVCVNESNSFTPPSYDYYDDFLYYSSSVSPDEFPFCHEVGGIAPYIGDGKCDVSNSNVYCGYDGGDCCSCTCVGTKDYVCGEHGYLCQDPTVSAACVNDSEMHPPEASQDYPDCTGHVGVIGNGYCDMGNNIAYCGYDGGDCCPCTCFDSEYFTCGANGYLCQDPTVSGTCPNNSLISSSTGDYSDCTGFAAVIGNGLCDIENNNVYCGYDGGDCCSCTCVSSVDFTCGGNGFDCQDPRTGCEENTLSGAVLGTIVGGGVFGLTLCCFITYRSVEGKRLRRNQAVHSIGEEAPQPDGGAGIYSTGSVQVESNLGTPS